MALRSIRPADGSPLANYVEDTDAVLEQKVESAAAGFRQWRRRSFAERAELLRKLGPRLREQASALADLMADEMGKPVAQGVAEIEKCAEACEFFATHGEAELAPEVVSTDARHSAVHYAPLGPLLAVMPWNFPFWQVVRCLAPALMVGNTVLLKHAANVTGCALALADLLEKCGAPAGVFTPLLLESRRLRSLVQHPAVAAVTLTGSVAAGQAVAALAGAALKKTVLELGGSDPYVVLADADLLHAARVCAMSRLINGGQSCIAAKRFIVVERVRRDFQAYLFDALGAVRTGDPRDPRTQLGPLARADLREELHGQVLRSVKAGATCLLGGRIPRGPGSYYPVTLLTDVTPGMPVFDEETFGPVAAVVSAGDEAEAIDLANRSSFGLGAAIFSQDVARAQHLAIHELAAGACFVNTFVRSDVRLPFGGIKNSGYGRELGRIGIREFANAKTVYVS